MGFLNLKKAASAYDSEPMKGNIERLVSFDSYHCLLSGSLGTSIRLKEQYGCLPAEFLEWLKICDGGLLFDTVLLSSKEYDKQLDLEFDTYDDMNTAEAYAEFDLPEGYVVFAMRSYGDPICFHMEGDDGKVYLWDVDDGEFSDIWDSFADWLTEEIDEALSLIADAALEPLAIKTEDVGDE